MAETIHVLGEGGMVIAMDMPLPEHIAQRLIKGQITRVNEDGTPYTVIGGVPGPVGPVPGPPLTEPARTALKPDWVGWAVVRGAKPEEAEAMTKNDLIEKYGTPIGT